MKSYAITPGGLVLLLFLASCTTQDYPTTGSIDRLSPELDRIIAHGSLPEILAEGFDWSEGPLWLPQKQTVIFSDIPNNSIFEWSDNGGLRLSLRASG